MTSLGMFVLAQAQSAEDESSNFLVSPNVGLMIWTLLAFLIAMFVLRKYAWPAITDALDKRQRAIEESIDVAERTRSDAQAVLQEYRERLREARAQADEIVARAQGRRGPRARDAREGQAPARGAHGADAARHRRRDAPRDPGDPQRGRRPHRHGDREGDAQDARRGRPEAPRRGGAARARLLGPRRRAAEELGNAMEEIAQVYARSLFEVAQERDKLDEVRDQIGQFADALSESRELQTFFFSPYFSTEEKKQGLGKALDGADETVANFLAVLIENHRMPALFRVRRELDRMWQDVNQLLPVQITSAVELDEAVTRQIGEEIGRQTGRKVELTSSVDPDVLGGIVVRVGNSILDASIRTRLERLRKQVARA